MDTRGLPDPSHQYDGIAHASAQARERVIVDDRRLRQQGQSCLAHSASRNSIRNGDGSRRKVGDRSAGCTKTLCDGDGKVGLFTLTWTPEVESKDDVRFSAKWSATAILGMGTGDDPSTPNVDEAYVGQKCRLRAGCAYLGFQYINNSTSILSALAKNVLGMIGDNPWALYTNLTLRL